MSPSALRHRVSWATGLVVGLFVLVATTSPTLASHPYVCFFASSNCGMGNLQPGDRPCNIGQVAGIFMHNQSVGRPKTVYLSFPCVGDVVNGQRWDTATERIFTRHTNTTYPSNHHANCWNRDIYTVTANCGRLY